jgi:hypothetical protein
MLILQILHLEKWMVVGGGLWRFDMNEACRHHTTSASVHQFLPSTSFPADGVERSLIYSLCIYYITIPAPKRSASKDMPAKWHLQPQLRHSLNLWIQRNFFTDKTLHNKALRQLVLPSGTFCPAAWPKRD